jgi:hypothetical protein
LGDIRGTTTTTGLEVQAFLHPGVYETGQSVSDTSILNVMLSVPPGTIPFARDAVVSLAPASSE